MFEVNVDTPTATDKQIDHHLKSPIHADFENVLHISVYLWTPKSKKKWHNYKNRIEMNLMTKFVQHHIPLFSK